MAMNPDSGKHVRAAINVTPMIDILLVLLIVFMAIAPGRSDGLDASVPQQNASATAAEPENPVILEIAADGAYRLNSQPVASAELGERLSRVYARRSSKVLFLKGAP